MMMMIIIVIIIIARRQANPKDKSKEGMTAPR